ncbi:MAG: quinone oxidoreductase [Acidobacteria bacterium]|nr:quinone oxidoreductase [Acidobacteriota bacterium]TDI08971.1 MAG: quinone oxidoreductase [Acidobacteriota bacterium]
MKAIRVHELGGPEALSYQDIPAPQPSQDEAIVQIEAIGLNFIDIYYREGLYPGTLPFTPGLEAAGTVSAVGSQVTEVQVGDRVAYSSAIGAYAQQASVPAWKLVPVPRDVDFQTAAAVMLQGMTAHYLSHSTYRLEPGHTALVHAAAGGVGLLLVQMAKMRGAQVVGTVSTQAKAELAVQAGADHVIVYTEKDFEAEVHRLTEDAGVEVVYDSVGKRTFEKSLNCLKPRGYLVLFGQSSGPVDPIDPQILNTKGSLFLTRPSLFHHISSREALLKRAEAVLKWVSSGDLKVHVSETFALAEAAQAHRALEGRKTTGKVLLVP